MNPAFKIASNEYNYVIEKYNKLALPDAAINEENYHEMMKFVHQSLQLHYTACNEVSYRNRLHLIKPSTHSVQVNQAIQTELAKSYLRSGIPGASMLLLDHPDYRDQQIEAIELFENTYGAPVLTEKWQSSRGLCLLDLFQKHPNWLKEKRILHIAPEPELMTAFTEGLGEHMQYLTLDGFRQDVDIQEDLTTLESIDDESFDVVICHRVFEHIKDDVSAFRAIHRVLTPGGVLNHSVPETLSMPQSNEWIVPDLTLHFHVRQYGADYTKRIDECGFKTTLHDHYLQMSPEALRAAGLYPMRIYHSQKI